MALSADEQRALAEIERRLVSDDPGLATCLTAFRRPGPARVLRTVLLVAMVSLMVYAMIPFRTHNARTTGTPGAGTPSNVSIAATGTGIGPQSAPPASASTSASAAGTPQAKSATPSAGQSAGTSQAQATGSQAAGSQAAGSQAAGSQATDHIASPVTSP
jgi:Protein of unknown function (DUF3040)